MGKHYDLVAIGGGSGGIATAIQAAKFGAKCAVIEAVENGLVPEKRYKNYIKIKKESTYHEMSYLDKKQKDKQFGKFVKSVMKQKKNRR